MFNPKFTITSKILDHLSQIAEVRLYNYALSADQIKRVYNEGAIFFGPSVGSP